ncbi:MAG TPA: hypothetical protein VGH74_05250 [Planctomycetaceae bacterium]
MRFSRNSKKWVSGLLAAGLALPLVGCGPESSTPATKPVTGTTGSARSTETSKPPPEQTGSTTGGSVEKGREVPEPSPADTSAEDKPAADKPDDSEKPKEE